MCLSLSKLILLLFSSESNTCPKYSINKKRGLFVISLPRDKISGVVSVRRLWLLTACGMKPGGNYDSCRHTCLICSDKVLNEVVGITFCANVSLQRRSAEYVDEKLVNILKLVLSIFIYWTTVTVRCHSHSLGRAQHLRRLCLVGFSLYCSSIFVFW